MLLLLSVAASVVSFIPDEVKAHSLHLPVSHLQRVRLQRVPGYNEQISFAAMLERSFTLMMTCRFENEIFIVVPVSQEETSSSPVSLPNC